MGRPTKINEDIKKVLLRCARLGYTDEEMAQIVGVTFQTLNNWKVRHSDYFESLKAAKKLADMEVEQTLHDKAMGNCSITEVHDGVDATGNVINKTVTKQIAPSDTAAIFWLKNRQRDKWRDKIDHNVNVDAETLELNFKIVSTEDE